MVAVTEDAGATAIVPEPQISSGLEKAAMVERFIVVQIQVRHVTSYLMTRCCEKIVHITPSAERCA